MYKFFYSYPCIWPCLWAILHKCNLCEPIDVRGDFEGMTSSSVMNNAAAAAEAWKRLCRHPMRIILSHIFPSTVGR